MSSASRNILHLPDSASQIEGDLSLNKVLPRLVPCTIESKPRQQITLSIPSNVCHLQHLLELVAYYSQPLFLMTGSILSSRQKLLDT